MKGVDEVTNTYLYIVSRDPEGVVICDWSGQSCDERSSSHACNR